MAGYRPNYQKKLRIAAKRERELLHAIRHAYSKDKIVDVAERLRHAKLAAYKAQWAQHTSSRLENYSVAVEAEKHKHIAKSLNAPVETMIEWYTRKLA